MSKNDNSDPNPVDKHVGDRIRSRRLFLRMSQEALAKALDVSFQQIQKYERGHNRVSASNLYEMAQFMKAPVQYFFDGLPQFWLSDAARDLPRAPLDRYSIEVAEAFDQIQHQPTRAKLRDLIVQLAPSAEEKAA